MDDFALKPTQQNYQIRLKFVDFQRTCLSLILSFINKYQEPPLERSLPLGILLVLWTTLEFLKTQHLGRDLLMTFFYMERK